MNEMNVGRFRLKLIPALLTGAFAILTFLTFSWGAIELIKVAALSGRSAVDRETASAFLSLPRISLCVGGLLLSVVGCYGSFSWIRGSLKVAIVATSTWLLGVIAVIAIISLGWVS